MTKVIAGVDIGGTGTKFGLVSSEGQVLAEDKIPTNISASFESYVAMLAEQINKMLEADSSFVLEGIGVGAPGGNYYTGKITGASNLPWKEDLAVVELMESHFDVPVVLSNDANATAMGEKVFGAAKDMKDFVMLTLGTGLGSGIVSGGQLLIGSQGMAAEFGHVMVTRDSIGRSCNCGRKGCLETYVSATGITRTVLELLDTTAMGSSLRSMDKEHITSHQIAQAAEKGDELALKAFEFTGQVLGRQLANITAIVNPEAIFLFGGLALAGDLLFKPAREAMESNMLGIFKDSVQLLPSGLGAQGAAIVGAASLAYEQTDYLHFEMN